MKNTKSIEKSSKETEAIKSKAELFLQSLKVKIMKKEEIVKIVNKDEIEEEVKKTLQLIKQKEEVKKENIKLSKTKFAGEEFEFEKELTEKELKIQKQAEKNKTHKELDELVDGINKKREINIYDKSKVDWKEYVDKNKLSKDLDYLRKDGMLEKKKFIDETNFKLLQQKREEERKAKYLASVNNKK